MNQEVLIKKFDGAMFDIYRRAKIEAKYNASIFLGMISDRGGLATAKFLINSPKESDGFTSLYLAGRPDLTVEAMVVEDPIWHSLFTTDELKKCRSRLAARGYTPKSNIN